MEATKKGIIDLKGKLIIIIDLAYIYKIKAEINIDKQCIKMKLNGC